MFKPNGSDNKLCYDQAVDKTAQVLHMRAEKLVQSYTCDQRDRSSLINLHKCLQLLK
jgi:hypothetical protein